MTTDVRKALPKKISAKQFVLSFRQIPTTIHPTIPASIEEAHHERVLLLKKKISVFAK